MSNVIDFAAAINARRTNSAILARETAAAARAEQERADIANKLGGTIGAQIIADVVMDLKAKDKEAGAPKFMPSYCDPENEVRGAKHEATKSLDITEIAKRMRADIKALNLAKGFKFAVRTQRYSGGQSIDISITAVPEDFRTMSEKAATWCKQFPNAEHRMPLSATDQHSEAYNELMGKLNRIHAAYNRDNSDSMVDYFDRRYYGSVGLDWRISHDLRKAEIADARDDYWADGCA